MAETNTSEINEQDDERCRHCGDGDPVPAHGYWKCPVCDAEWNGDDEDECDQ